MRPNAFGTTDAETCPDGDRTVELVLFLAAAEGAFCDTHVDPISVAQALGDAVFVAAACPPGQVDVLPRRPSVP